MSREIKFRAWDKVRGIMLVNHTFKTIAVTGLYDIENLEWLQFTGLKDKNGKEIYEGDILGSEAFGSLSPYREVKWEVNEWGNCNHYADYESRILAAEVVGNIYDNPKLLEGCKRERIR